MVQRVAFATMVALAAVGLVAAEAAPAAPAPSCAAAGLAAARRAAQARHAAGDAKAAWTSLQPFLGLDCLAAAPRAPKPAARDALSTFAWLVDDAYVYGADPRLGKDAPDADACIELLRPLTDDDLKPHPWMSPALQAATIANLKACAKSCVPAACVPFRAQVWTRYTSIARAFRRQACPKGPGQALDAQTCLEVRPGTQGFDFAWDDPFKRRTPAEIRDSCPSLTRHAPGDAAATRLALPEASALRDPDTCCGRFEILVSPERHELVIASKGGVRDCFGGTGERIVEEVYRLEPGADAAGLVRDNSQGLH